MRTTRQEEISSRYVWVAKGASDDEYHYIRTRGRGEVFRTIYFAGRHPLYAWRSCQVAVVLLLLLRRSYGLFALEINQLQNYYYYYYHPVNGIRVESSSSSLVQSWLHHKTTALHLPWLAVGVDLYFCP